MIKRIWHWLFGKPCAHEWDVAKNTMTVIGDWGALQSRYVQVTRFCVKCTKLVKHRE